MCKAAVNELIEKTVQREEWLLHNRVFHPACNCLPTRADLIGQILVH